MMKNSRVDIVNHAIDRISFISIVQRFSQNRLNIEGRVKVSLDELNEEPKFDVLILPQYPFKS